MQGSLTQLRKITQNSVAHFVKEALVTTPQGYATPLSMAALFWLYEEWRVFRGVSDRYAILNQRTFSCVFTRLDPDVVSIQPLARKTKQVTSHFIIAPETPVFLNPRPVALIPEPAIMSISGNENIGVASGPFDAVATLGRAPVEIQDHLRILTKYQAR